MGQHGSKHSEEGDVVKPLRGPSKRPLRGVKARNESMTGLRHSGNSHNIFLFGLDIAAPVEITPFMDDAGQIWRTNEAVRDAHGDLLWAKLHIATPFLEQYLNVTSDSQDGFLNNVRKVSLTAQDIRSVISLVEMRQDQRKG